jgi:hypothetical protein
MHVQDSLETSFTLINGGILTTICFDNFDNPLYINFQKILQIKYINIFLNLWIDCDSILMQFECNLIFHQILLNSNHQNFHIILMTFDEISNDTQIKSKSNHNKFICLKIYCKVIFFPFLRFFVNLYSVDYEDCQNN